MLQQQKTWTITEIRDGERTEILSGATHLEALIALRRAMYGDNESLLAASESSVHELPVAA